MAQVDVLLPHAAGVGSPYLRAVEIAPSLLEIRLGRGKGGAGVDELRLAKRKRIGLAALTEIQPFLRRQDRLRTLLLEPELGPGDFGFGGDHELAIVVWIDFEKRFSGFEETAGDEGRGDPDGPAGYFGYQLALRTRADRALTFHDQGHVDDMDGGNAYDGRSNARPARLDLRFEQDHCDRADCCGNENC